MILEVLAACSPQELNNWSVQYTIILHKHHTSR